jgi:arylsulfatase A-like enzyme
LIAVASGLGCGTSHVDPARWNVVFIVVDTLRQDHLSLYGYDRPTSPALDAFSRQAIVFDDARSQAGCTFPSVNSYLTSQHPQVFVQDMKRHGCGISEQWPTLAQMLESEGYATAAVSSSAVVRANPSKYNPDGGFGAGFETFDETCMEKPAECVNARAFEILDDIASPFFMYLHYMEPHMPYQPPATHGPVFRSQSGQPSTDSEREPVSLNRKIHRVGDMLYEDGEEIDFTDADLACMVDLYDEEIHYFDAQFQELMQRLQVDGVADRTIIIVASDHGEELLDHGHIWHCRDFTFDTVIRTPLIMKIPGVEHPGRRRFMVQNLDIVPTVLDYLGINASQYSLEGSSLRPVIEEQGPIHEHVFCWQRYARSVTDGRFKLVYDIRSGDTSLFDLRLDPAEQKDVKASWPQVADDLSQVLLDWMEEVEGHDDLAERVLQAKRVHDMLEALGYLRHTDGEERQQTPARSQSPQDQGLSPPQNR